MLEAEDIPWAPHVRACVSDDWLIALDLRGDRYWAFARSASVDALGADLAAKGLLAEGAASSNDFGWDWLSVAERIAPDWLLVAEAALWAKEIVKSGRLDRAFAWLADRKRPPSGRASMIGAKAPLNEASALRARFDVLRMWAPYAYVCLFDSLCLARFLRRRGCAAELVIGVRARPFAAHCWIEANGIVLNTGGEDCASFSTIARV